MQNSQEIQNLNLTVDRVIFSDNSNGFCIFSAKAPDNNKNCPGLITAKGYVGSLQAKDTLLISGKWVDHPKFGRQISVENFSYPEISGEKSLYAFLCSGFVKGVGPSLAKVIIKHFGSKTSEVLNDRPKDLLKVSGIGEKKMESISASWKEHAKKKNDIVKLQEWGVGPSTVQKILKKFEDKDIIPFLQANPYVLTDLDNVGFLIADKIAINIGLEKDSEHRISAAISFALTEAGVKGGHVYLSSLDLVKATNELLGFEERNEDMLKRIAEVLENLCQSGKVVYDDGKYYEPWTYACEQGLAKSIGRLEGSVAPFPYSIEEMISGYEKQFDFVFDASQKNAISNILDNKVSVVTGGPGTGKTTIIKAAIYMAQLAGLKDISLVAPTGRAAKRLSESTGRPASTIHRFLGYNPNNGFSKNSKDPAPSDMVFCDEASMLDLFLSYSLFSALKNQTRLVLIGDVFQLPSVGAGNVLRDMIDSRKINVSVLDQIHRQEEGSWISHNAHAVKFGEIGDMNLSNQTKDFFWTSVPLKDENKEDIPPFERNKIIQTHIFNTIRRLTKKGFSFDDIQILSPMYKTASGVQELNQKIQELISSKQERKSVKIGFKVFAEGDRVMQLKNNYEKNVFNGDQGKIVLIDKDDASLRVMFGENEINYSFLECDELVLSYACTIHKSQGSEYKVVIIPVTTSHFVMLQRNLLYTAITRAKDMCILIGEKKALSIAIKNDKPVIRNTTLKELLRDAV